MNNRKTKIIVLASNLLLFLFTGLALEAALVIKNGTNFTISAENVGSVESHKSKTFPNKGNEVTFHIVELEAKTLPALFRLGSKETTEWRPFRDPYAKHYGTPVIEISAMSIGPYDGEPNNLITLQQKSAIK